tara:strand:- start:635 stop:1177 length:543 start_codon:yes stop_codon:yes gene_type:complete
MEIQPTNEWGKRKVTLFALEENKAIINSSGYNVDDRTFSINWKEDDDIPSWLQQGNLIKIPFKIFMGYATFDKFAEIGVQVIKSAPRKANVEEEFKKEFPEGTVENLKEDDTDFNFGANTKKPTDKLNGHSDDPIQAKINNYADFYAKIFTTINKHKYLQQLDTGLKKDIATSFFIQLNR